MEKINHRTGFKNLLSNTKYKHDVENIMYLYDMVDSIINSTTSHNTYYDSESEKDPTPQGDIEQSSTSHNPNIMRPFADTHKLIGGNQDV